MITSFFIGVAILLVLLLASLPIPFVFGAVVAFMTETTTVGMKSLMLWALPQMCSFVLLASPMFIVAGTLMGGSGIAKRLLDFVDMFVGHIRGGLGIVACVTCAVIGAISGSGFTGVAATGPMLIPRMQEMGYPKGYATALVTSASILGLLIPPSVIMVIYGWVTETSILACFLSTLVPGLLICFLMCVVNMYWCRNFDLKLADKAILLEKRKKIVPITLHAAPALLMPLIILGGIYGGVFTATEAAVVAAIYAIPVGLFIYKAMKLKKLYELLHESGIMVGSIMAMIFTGLMLGQIYAMLQVPQAVATMVFSLTTNKYILLLLINIFLFFVGMVVSDTMGMLICAPLLLPLVVSIGVDPIHFAAIMGVNLAMGGITPPYASILYFGMKVGKAEFSEIIKPVLSFIVFAYLPVIALTSLIPSLSLAIPKMLGY
ncbi:TRAP transporter large permease [Cloacibacillus evryensis]|uniref:TRAP transporter large permease n=1 Tax=Cloacibacillus evryensis TaxID=508460 RepID=UPI00210D4291|nr:TRAP transporter large permease [Cloacibacillus evryensis]MCQ4765397.1 TRAP transporter large permease [Cloacibacillus evryensis]